MNASLLSRITIEPGKCGGKPCIRGMRIRVSDILEMLGEGVSMEEVLADFPDLERDDILASLQFAARRRHRTPCCMKFWVRTRVQAHTILE